MIDYIALEKYAENRSVLFVEDDENIRKETKELLEEIFPYVDIACDGKDGLNKYLEYKKEKGSFFDVLITDIKMPIMDGIELTKEIYKHNNEQLIIVLSAHSEAKYLLELVNIGISHFITKPLEYNSFLHVLYTKLEELYEKNNIEITESNEIIINENLHWNKETKQLLDENKTSIKLTKKEILFLSLLLKDKEKTYTIEELLVHLWDDDSSLADITNLKNIISRLRKKVPSLDIENVYGFGYRINLK